MYCAYEESKCIPSLSVVFVVALEKCVKSGWALYRVAQVVAASLVTLLLV